MSYLTRKGAEQATGLHVAAARARRIRAHGADGVVLDATCGIGSDSVALCDAGLSCVSADHGWTEASKKWSSNDESIRKAHTSVFRYHNTCVLFHAIGMCGTDRTGYYSKTRMEFGFSRGESSISRL
jgi:hypothetical protein